MCQCRESTVYRGTSVDGGSNTAWSMFFSLYFCISWCGNSMCQRQERKEQYYYAAPPQKRPIDYMFLWFLQNQWLVIWLLVCSGRGLLENKGQQGMNSFNRLTSTETRTLEQGILSKRCSSASGVVRYQSSAGTQKCKKNIKSKQHQRSKRYFYFDHIVSLILVNQSTQNPILDYSQTFWKHSYQNSAGSNIPNPFNTY